VADLLSSELSDLGDVPTTRRLLFDNVAKAVSDLPPVANQRYTLKLSDVGYVGPEQYTRADEKRAILEGRSLTRRLQGTWNLVDNATQRAVDARKLTLGNVPYLTSSGTYINNGSEYNLQNQLRIYPGIFTRRKETGELEAHANVAKGFGHRYHLDPETGQFQMQVGQANLQLYPILRALGVSDRQLRERWGDQLFAANTKKIDPQALPKLYQKIYRKPYSERDGELNQLIRQAIENVEIDPDIAKQTLGQPFSKLNLDAILATADKLLKVNKGEADADDRDALHYQKVFSAEDLFPGRIKTATGLLRSLLWKLTADGNLKRMRPGVFEKSLRGTLLDTGLGNLMEEVNPMEILDARSRITKLGEGAIGSLDAVPDESRSIQPTQLGFLDLVVTPESARAGIDTRLAINLKKDKQNRVYTRYFDPKTQQTRWLSPQQTVGRTIAYPGELKSGEPYVRAISNGREDYVPRQQVDLELHHMTDAFGPAANLIPLKAAAQGQRVSMGARMLTQALPLVQGEAPLVRAALPDNPQRSFDEEYGRFAGAVHADTEGTVLGIANNNVQVRGLDGKVRDYELDYYRPYNRKTAIHNTPVVQVGQRVRQGDLLARSNFTDDKGAVALGVNARVAYIPNGWNTDDAIVISESMAKRLTSQHLYQHTLDQAEGIKSGKKHFVSVFPATYNRHVLGKFDDDGVIKPGETVREGEPLVLATKQVTAGPRLGRRKHSYADATVTWDHHSDGLVTDVYKGKNGINVIVNSTAGMEVGDKLSGRFGDKGIISEIKPDGQMPHGEDGKPYEILVNPQGVISRGNPAQDIEAALGKISALTGQPYRLVDFGDISNLAEWANQELQRRGLQSTETLVDPATGRKIPGVQTGSRYFMKLHHSVEGKLQGRGLGSYSAEGTPAKGGKEGAKTFGFLNLLATLSHGAYGVINDARMNRGQQNEQMWRQFMSGYDPGEPTVPHMYEKFVHQLQAAGINPLKTGTKTQLMAMTPEAVEALTENRELKNAETVDWRVDNLAPIKGGLFDESLTGGHGGKRWAHIKLPEPFPNPVMEEPIRRVLGLTENQFLDVLAGKQGFAGPGKLTEPSAKNTGPQAIYRALNNLDLDEEIKRASSEIRGSKKTARDAAIRRQQFFKGAKATNTHPRDWFLQKVPVLPPLFRPVSLIKGTQQTLVADPNVLYKDLLDANDDLKNLAGRVSEVGDERLAVYNAFKAVAGLGDPIQPQHQEQGVKGLLKAILGSSPKRGVFQRKLLGGTVDLVGRTTITPNPDLDIDDVLIPEDAAWEIYKPFIVRRLVRRGIGRIRAMELAERKSDEARHALVTEMGERPVLVDRAPVLHRFGVMALKPKLTKAKTLQFSPLITKGFGADFDGDAVQFHVPFSAQAVQDAYAKMLPSKNLFSPANFRVHQVPQQEFVAGLWLSTTAKNDRHPRVFRSAQDAIRAYQRGEIDLGQELEIAET
jgi:DNA-directed RNA polymerase beta subunit